MIGSRPLLRERVLCRLFFFGYRMTNTFLDGAIMQTLLRRLFGHPSVVDPQRDDFTSTTHEFLTNKDRAEGVKRLAQIYEPFKVIQRFLALCVVLSDGLGTLCATVCYLYHGVHH